MEGPSLEWSVYHFEDVTSPHICGLDGSSDDALPMVTAAPSTLTLGRCGLKKVDQLQRGSQGVVYAAVDESQSGSSGVEVAVKRLYKQDNGRGRIGISETILREATMLRYANSRQDVWMATESSSPPAHHRLNESARIVRLLRIVEAPHRELCLVLERCHTDLSALTIQAKDGRRNVRSTFSRREEVERPAATPGRQPFPIPVVRFLLRRVLRLVDFLHNECGMLHRDLKLSNILVTKQGELRLSDFGSARFLVKSLEACEHRESSIVNQDPSSTGALCYTPGTQRTTLLYQAPECLVGGRGSGSAVDVWSVGVIFAELLRRSHLFHSAHGQIALLAAITKLLGSCGTEFSNFPEELNDNKEDETVCQPMGTFDAKFPTGIVPTEGAHLLRRMLCVCPEKRITVEDALKHAFLTFDGWEADDVEGQRLWLPLIHRQEEESKRSIRGAALQLL